MNMLPHPESFDWIEHESGNVTLVPADEHFGRTLQGFFQYLHEQSDYYQGLMRRLGLQPTTPPLELLDRLPPTEKETYRDVLQLEALTALNYRSFVCDYSSGSTAKCVLRLCTQADDLGEQAVTEQVFSRLGMGPGDRFVCMDIGAPEIYDFYFRAARRLGVERYSFLHLNGDNGSACAPLQALQPSILLVVPSLLIRVWPVVRDYWTAENCPIRVMIHMGEPMHPSFRREVMDQWGCRIYSFYGTTETGGLAGECGKSHGLHFDPRFVLPTLENPRRLEKGGFEGDALISTLHVKTQSVVKYRIGDRIRLTTEPCPCGDPLPRLYFLGRTSDAFVIAGEKFSYSMLLEALRSKAPPLQLMSLEIEESPSARPSALLKVHLPNSFQAAEKAFRAVLQEDVFELDAMYRYGLVDFEFVFHPVGWFKGRKIKRLVDRRSHMGFGDDSKPGQQ